MEIQKPGVYLDEDVLKVPGQKYVLLSFVGPELPQKNDKYGIKVRGTFDTREEAESHAKAIISIDPNFHVFVADMYRWLLVPPNADDVENQVYPDEYLNELIQGHKESQAKAKEFFDARLTEKIPQEELSKNIETASASGSWADQMDDDDN